MERRRFMIEDIHIGTRHRSPDMGKVSEIANSIREVGIMNHPAVCIRDNVVLDDGEISDAVPVLIFGRHRLLALLANGETTVECAVHDVDDLRAEIMEIDENLARAELSPAQEAAHVRRRQEIWTEINGAKRVGTFGQYLAKSMGRPKTGDFAREIADVTGSSKSQVNMKIARARELGPDIKRIVGTSLDKGVEMDALIKLPKPEREAVIAQAEAGEIVTARQPETQPALDAEEQRFWKYWAGLSIEAKRRVLPQLKALSA